MNPKIIFFVTEDWYFWSHRMPLARAARDSGYSVAVVTNVSHHADLITGEGFRLVPVRLSRRSRNPLREIRLISDLVSIYRAERPDIVHHVALKPILYGGFASLIAGIPCVINAVTGLGYVFSSRQLYARILRPFVTAAFRAILRKKGSMVIVQNPDDHALLVGRGIANRSQVVVIKGSGVDLGRYAPAPEPEGEIVVLLASRLLWDKGVGEFAEAASLLKQEGSTARFVLVGENDPENPSSISAATLEHWRESGVVEWWGRSEDMPSTLALSHIVCLPSYREGLPKVLIEAAACSRPIISTDVPGCREVVRHGENGLLVPARNSRALADAFWTLIRDREMRLRMGLKGREIAVSEFSVERVVRETMDIYERLLCRQF